jgi:hypothetical protein
MAGAILHIGNLPDLPLDAAAEFFAKVVPGIREDFRDFDDLELVLTIVFEPAGHEHRAWRLAMVQELAREVAPNRINGVVSGDVQAIEQIVAFLNSASGVTGQLLAD